MIKKRLVRALEIGFFVLLVFIPQISLAAGPIYLEATSVVDVKQKRNDKSKTISTLISGDTFYVSKKKYGPWRKILIDSESSGKIIGWVRLKKLKGNVRRIKEDEILLPDDSDEEIPEEEVVEPQISKRDRGRNLYFGKTGFGVSYAASYMTWGERTFTTSDDVKWKIAESSSQTFFLGLFADLKFGESLVLRPYINLRETEFEGESNSDFLNARQTSFRQTYQSLGVLAKFYSDSKKWWWGLAFEGSQGQSLEIDFDGDSVDTEEGDLSFFMIGALSFGYDIAITDRFFFLPEARLGSVFNQDPQIFFFEGYLSIGYGI